MSGAGHQPTTERLTLTLDDLDHVPERDRPTHLFPRGYDATVPQTALCGMVIHPPFRPRRGTNERELCVVCVDVRERRQGHRD